MTPSDRQGEADAAISDPLAESQKQRIAAMHIITTGALIVTLAYSVVIALFLVEDYLLITVFNVCFVIIYAFLRGPITPERAHVHAVLLLTAGTAQITISSAIFLPIATGNHYFLMLIPLFSLLIIEPRRVRWWQMFSVVGALLMIWFEFVRMEYVPPLAYRMNGANHSLTRSLNILIVLFLGGYVIRLFHRGLHIAKKRLHASYLSSDDLLKNTLPSPIVKRLKDGEEIIADAVSSASVLFADIVGFTALSSNQPARDTVVMLNHVFSAFDTLVVHRDLEKIKTIGDSYMVAAGIPISRDDHALQLVELAEEMLLVMENYNQTADHALSVRIGINSGPMVAGVLGKKKLSYDIWGDTVNLASRLESSGMTGRIQVSKSVVQQVKFHRKLHFEPRGVIEMKGYGAVETYFYIPENNKTTE